MKIRGTAKSVIPQQEVLHEFGLNVGGVFVFGLCALGVGTGGIEVAFDGGGRMGWVLL